MAAQPVISAAAAAPDTSIELAELGALTPISRTGGQGRVFRPEVQQEELAHVQQEELASAIVVKLYRAPPSAMAAVALRQMIVWARGLAAEERRRLHRTAAWPLATVTAGEALAGIVMQDVRARFELPFLMPSGRVANVMLQLEHLLGPDDFLRQRGHRIMLDTATRALAAERICAAFAFLHRHAIVVSDVSPSNLLISLAAGGPEASFIDCDSMVFHGRQALPSVETADWQMPPTFAERPLTRAADAYKLGLIVLRLFARSSDARDPSAHLDHIPAPLHDLLERALSQNTSNRPPAGEWQLALRRTLADEHLCSRHPGPRPPVRIPKPAPAHRPIERPAPVRAAATSTGAAPAHAPASASGGVPAGFLSRGFTVAWLVVGLLLLLMFVRLLQSMALSQEGGLGLSRYGAHPSGGYLYRSREEGPSRPGGGAPVEEERTAEGGAVSR